MPLFVTVTPGTTVSSSTTLDAATLNLLGTPSVDVTGTVDGGSVSITAGSVPLSSLTSQAVNTIVGNASGAINSPTALDASIDFTLSSNTFQIKARAVTPSKMFDLDGTAPKILGRFDSGSGDVQTNLLVGSNLTTSSNTLNTLVPKIEFTNYTSTTSFQLPTSRITAFELTNLTTSIIPQKNSSKVFVQFNIAYSLTSENPFAFILQRVIGSVVQELGIPSSPGNRTYGIKTAIPDLNQYQTNNICIGFIDSPLTTQSVSYKIRVYGSLANTFYLNRPTNATDGVRTSHSTSQTILQEILV